MTELKLQPCPFCGATGVPKSWRGRTYQKITHAADCYFGGSHCWMDHDDRFESWNRRASDAERFVELASNRIREGHGIVMTPTENGILVTGFRKAYMDATVAECAAKIAQGEEGKG